MARYRSTTPSSHLAADEVVAMTEALEVQMTTALLEAAAEGPLLKQMTTGLQMPPTVKKETAELGQ